jgi:hypothetical protein
MSASTASTHGSGARAVRQGRSRVRVRMSAGTIVARTLGKVETMSSRMLAGGVLVLGVVLGSAAYASGGADPLSSCGSDSDCAGFGKCSNGECGSCGSDSDCNGYGKCANGKCGACGSDSDCKIGQCSNGRCGSCGSDSDCHGNGKCANGKCGSCGSDSDCAVGKCSNSQCGSCGSDSDCHGGRCSSGRCSNAQ